MEIMKRVEALVALGKALTNISEEELSTLCGEVKRNNAWFQPEDTKRALKGIISILQKDKLDSWLEKYSGLEKIAQKNIGLILAGNIPAVGFHDYLTVLLSGNKGFAKLSSQDRILLPFIQSILLEIAPILAKEISFVDKLSLENLDAVIATGSDNSSRYFEAYFQKVPNIIRKNRTSVALLTGSETEEDLVNLAKDVFWYYGLGCRNVSKLYVPKAYDFTKLLDLFEYMKEYIVYQNKYVNNYDYNKSIFLVNGVEHLDNGFLLLKKSQDLVSPISVLNYEEYDTKEEILLDKQKIQCIVGSDYLNFGQTQFPEPWDYADGVDTLNFFLSDL